MPWGSVICLIVIRSKVKEGGEDVPRAETMGDLKKMKLSTHLIAGSTPWNFSKAIVAPTTFPWMPPAMANPSIAMCCM